MQHVESIPASSRTADPASYRDPSGFVFESEGIIYRQVNSIGLADYELLMSSGLYQHLVGKGLLIPHEQVNIAVGDPQAAVILQPQRIPFVSYPYEWSFNMLKDAALLTLELATEAMGYGMMLKDATPFNIQWLGGRLVFIDTLSFTAYDETRPWIAYRQFCEAFLAPLLLMSYTRAPMQQLMLGWPEGIPVPLAGRLLPWRTKFNLPVWLHIHLHGKISRRPDAAPTQKHRGNFSLNKLKNLLASLQTLVRKLGLPPENSTWSGYYEEAAGRETYLEQKKTIIAAWMAELPAARTVADLGANEGMFSQIAADAGKTVIAADLDPFCVDSLYRSIRKSKQQSILPLVQDLSLPSPGIGVNNAERTTFISRCRPDLVMALAFIHHLVIGRNVPVEKLVTMFAQMTDTLILEWVPPTDEKVHVLVEHKDISFPFYNEAFVLAAFNVSFNLARKQEITGSGRKLWLFRKRSQTNS